MSFLRYKLDGYSNITEIAEKLGEAFTLAFGKAEGKQGGISETAFDLSEFCKKAVVLFDINPIQIGNYTPYEVMLLAKQKRERETRLFEDNITFTWHMEAFARQKKFNFIKNKKSNFIAIIQNQWFPRL